MRAEFDGYSASIARTVPATMSVNIRAVISKSVIDGGVSIECGSVECSHHL